MVAYIVIGDSLSLVVFPLVSLSVACISTEKVEKIVEKRVGG